MNGKSRGRSSSSAPFDEWLAATESGHASELDSGLRTRHSIQDVLERVKRKHHSDGVLESGEGSEQASAAGGIDADDDDAIVVLTKDSPDSRLRDLATDLGSVFAPTVPNVGSNWSEFS